MMAFTSNGCLKEQRVKIQKTSVRATTLMSSIKNLLDDGFATDFEIKISGKSYPVHRIVLAASSNYFKTMLSHKMEESNEGFVEIKGLDGDAVKACIDYLYCGEVESDDVVAVEPLLKASDLLQITDLKRYLFEALLGMLDVINCLVVRRYGMMYNSETTVKLCDRFLAENLPAVAKMSNQWVWLSYHEVHESIQSSNDRSTSNLWPAIVKWAEHDEESRKVHILELIGLIIPLDIVITVTRIMIHPLIMKNDDCACCLLENVIEPNICGVARYMNMDNCFRLNKLAKKFQSKGLETVTQDYMSQNFQQLSDSGWMNELNYEDLSSIMSGSCNASEEGKFKAISNWAEVCQSRIQDFVTLFLQLDLSRVSPDFIQNTIRKNEIVSSNAECNNKLLDALYEHTKSHNLQKPAMSELAHVGKHKFESGDEVLAQMWSHDPPLEASLDPAYAEIHHIIRSALED